MADRVEEARNKIVDRTRDGVFMGRMAWRLYHEELAALEQALTARAQAPLIEAMNKAVGFLDREPRLPLHATEVLLKALETIR